MQTAISTEVVSFHDTQLITFKKDEVIYTAVRPIVEAMGLEWSGQVKKLSNPKFNCVHIYTVAQDGKNRETLCMPIRKLNGWLFSINPEKVRSDLKAKVIQYQEECFEVLFNYWNNGVAVNPRRVTISVEQQAQIRQAIAKRCKNSSTHYQTVYTAIGKHFNIPRYSELLASDFDECMAFIDDFSLALPAINLSQDDIKTLAKALTYANAYAEFMAKTKDDRVQSVVSTYSNYSHSEDDGFMIVFRPKYKQDIDNAYNVIRRLACAA